MRDFSITVMGAAWKELGQKSVMSSHPFGWSRSATISAQESKPNALLSADFLKIKPGWMNLMKSTLETK